MNSDSDRIIGTLVVGGQKVVNDQRINIATWMINPNMNDPTSAMFIPFPKRLFIGNPAWSTPGMVSGLARKIAQRGFMVPRDFVINTYGHPYLSNRSGIQLNDNLLANNYYLEVQSSHHSWNSRSDVGWGKSTFNCQQIGIVSTPQGGQPTPYLWDKYVTS